MAEEGFKDTFTLQQVIRNLNDTLDGGTTGQALLKASGTDFDYSWGDVVTTVAVSDLADGTDGELITWDASGVASTVAVGTATHVLTSNGAGAAPTFQAPAGGLDPDSDTVDITGNWTFSGIPTFSGVQINSNTDWILGSFNFVSGWINTKSYSQTNFRSISHAVNTNIAKFTGTMLWDSTNGRPVWASGSANGSVWVDHAGTTVHTPV